MGFSSKTCYVHKHYYFTTRAAKVRQLQHQFESLIHLAIHMHQERSVVLKYPTTTLITSAFIYGSLQSIARS